MKSTRPNVLLIYTGGTIGMVHDPNSGSLKPFDFNVLSKQVPELKEINVNLKTIAFKHPIDSSDMQPAIWVQIAELIHKHYNSVDGFVVLHGSDTMSYTSSALSFMLENLKKPVVLTGSQLPIGIIRTDGKENLITAIEIAAARKNGKPIVQEVCIYFEYKLYRGNRTFKYNSEHFDAFQSPNYPLLAEAGVDIVFNENALSKPNPKPFKVNSRLSNDIAVLHLFPGISKEVVQSILHTKGLKAVLLLTYGAGNATTEKWFIIELEKIIKNGVYVLNVTQCLQGKVIQGMYQTSSMLKKIGVIGGGDITFEAAVTKLMYVLGQKKTKQQMISELSKGIRGEQSSN